MTHRLLLSVGTMGLASQCMQGWGCAGKHRLADVTLHTLRLQQMTGREPATGLRPVAHNLLRYRRRCGRNRKNTSSTLLTPSLDIGSSSSSMDGPDQVLRSGPARMQGALQRQRNQLPPFADVVASEGVIRLVRIRRPAVNSDRLLLPSCHGRDVYL